MHGRPPRSQNHGFDNAEPAMRAMFVADGPFASSVRSRSAHTLDEGGALVVPGFRNLEVYGLVAKLLGFERWAAPNNGTRGFWDGWVDD